MTPDISTPSGNDFDLAQPKQAQTEHEPGVGENVDFTFLLSCDYSCSSFANSQVTSEIDQLMSHLEERLQED